MANQSNSVLTEEFLMDIYYTCMSNDYVLAVVVANIQKDYLPDKDFIKLHTSLADYYKEYKTPPSFSVLKQSVSHDRGVSNLLDDIFESSTAIATDQVLVQLEDYIKQVRFQKTYKEVGDLYNRKGYAKAAEVLQEYTKWAQSFSLRESEFVDVISTFEMRFKENRQKHSEDNKLPPIVRFYIDELDEKNGGRDLRTQLTCFMAPTGVGKSHIARWVGKMACQVDSLNVLHIQLEGSRSETVNAYSAALVACNTFRYETGCIRDADINKYNEMLQAISGRLFVKSYPKFNCNVSTLDIRNAIHDFKKRYGLRVDIVIIDSMDLLTDSTGRQYGDNSERLKRISVANDLKDLAADENVWMVTTYQSTIENRDWLNDEKNVLTEFNSSEAKGIARPVTHLITLNQSDRERKEHVMRLNVAKSRFFERGEPFKIATDYDNEQFYDRQRTISINLVKD